MARCNGDSGYFDTRNVSQQRFRRGQALRIDGRQIDDETHDGRARVLAAPNSEAANLDQADQFACRPDDDLSVMCVQMDTVIAHQNGRRNLSGTARQDQVERQARFAGARGPADQHGVPADPDG
jgi:hypothetical protein